MLCRDAALLKTGIVIIGMLFSMALLGCRGDQEYTFVDFSKTVPESDLQSQVPPNKSLRVAIAAMVSPKETFSYYHELMKFIGGNAGYEIQLIQRKTYQEVTELLNQGQIDLAFICSGPYAVHKQQYGFEALAVPVVRGAPFYHSYLIVHKDSACAGLADLRNHVFALSDPDSNTGALVPGYWLSQMGEGADTFFKKVIYTYSHDNSIMAVAKGLADGAAVDGHKWEYFMHRNPMYAGMTRVIRKSEPFGAPPLVAARHVPASLKANLSRILLTMHETSEGKRILAELMIDHFVPPREEWYEPIRGMYRTIRASGKGNREAQKS